MYTNTVNVFIADDHALFADGVEQVLFSEPGFNVTGKFNDSKLLMQAFNSSVPHILLLDIHMPPVSGIEIAAIVKKKYPSVKIIIISMVMDKRIIEQLKVIGVEGYVGKTIDSHTLLDGMQRVIKGELVYETPPREKPLNAIPSQLMKYKLTERELEIIHLIKDGMTTKKIAETLYLSEYTIETHRKNILKKLELHTPAEIIAFANRHLS
jgi:DNA-binding NarL/FixJ family response regulator